MTTKIIYSNPVFPHLIENQEVDLEFFHKDADFYGVLIDKKYYDLEINKARFMNKSEILIEGFIHTEDNVGRIAFHINYSQNTA